MNPTFTREDLTKAFSQLEAHYAGGYVFLYTRREWESYRALFQEYKAQGTVLGKKGTESLVFFLVPFLSLADWTDEEFNKAEEDPFGKIGSKYGVDCYLLKPFKECDKESL